MASVAASRHCCCRCVGAAGVTRAQPRWSMPCWQEATGAWRRPSMCLDTRALDGGMQQLLIPAAPPSPAVGGPVSGQHGRPSAPNPLQYDLTELAGLDYLSSPSGVIQAAQELAAAAFGAQHTWFLVNGCSVGIHAAVMATVRPGEALLLARNCHLSAFSACVLADAVPVWLQPEQDALHGVTHCITLKQLDQGFRAAEQRGLRVGAVLAVSPTYYGAVGRISELACICRQRGVPLLVDEAHGGHFGPMAQDLSRQQPEHGIGSGDAMPAPSSQKQQLQQVLVPALEAGADLVMHSTHKVLTAMTQAAMLHLSRRSRVNPNRINKALQVLQTSSPSYILLSSLDAARRHALLPGVWHVPLAAADAARLQLSRLPGVSLLQDGSCGAQHSVLGFDPLRLVVNVAGLGLTGFAAAAWLEEEHGVVPELATSKMVVFVFGPGSTMADAAKLGEACQQLSTAHKSAGALAAEAQPSYLTAANNEDYGSSLVDLQGVEGQPKQQSRGAVSVDSAAMTPRQAFFADTATVPLHAAAGCVSAELLCPYPPGVPVVFPGERFTPAIIQLLQDTLAGGGVVTGAQDGSLQSVTVVTDYACFMVRAGSHQQPGQH